MCYDIMPKVLAKAHLLGKYANDSKDMRNLLGHGLLFSLITIHTISISITMFLGLY